MASINCEDIAGPCVLQGLTASLLRNCECAKSARYLGKQPRKSIEFYLGADTFFEPVEGILCTTTSAIQDIDMARFRAHVLAAQQLLSCADVGPQSQSHRNGKTGDN